MKKIGEIRSSGPGGIPLKDFWGKPRSDIHVDLDVSKITSEISHQTREFERQIESLKDAQYYAAEQVESALAQATEDIEKSISSQWILQARKKIEKAEELLRAGLVSESLKLCSDAISQDPSNMDSYIVASVAYGLANENDRSKECLRKTIHLLNTSEYATDVRAHLEVLENIFQSEFKEDLIPDYLGVLKKNFLGLLKKKDYVYDLILKLSEISHDIAIEVSEKYFELWSGFFKKEIAKEKYDSWSDSNTLNYLYFRACYFDLHKRLGRVVEMGNNIFLDISYNPNRYSVLKNAVEPLIIHYPDLLPETKDFIRRECRNALKNWEADIETEKRTNAKKWTKGLSGGALFGLWFLGWIIFIMLLGQASFSATGTTGFIAAILSIASVVGINLLVKSSRIEKRFNEDMREYRDFLALIGNYEQISSISESNGEKEKHKNDIPAFNFCPECRAKVQSDDRFCQECGKGLG